jgi:hypothetical protein
VTRPVQIARAALTPASTAMVSRLHDLGSRVVVVHPTPGRGGEGIARDVLQALGKRFRAAHPARLCGYKHSRRSGCAPN